MIELTEQQRKEVGDTAQPVRVNDPTTRWEFSLVRAELLARFPSALGDLDRRDAYSAIDRSFVSGWDDPKVSEYDTFEHQKR